MHMRAFIGFAFALNLLLSNVCFLGTAYAASPIDGGETVLSREVPMSFNVVTCTWVHTEDGWKPTPDSPCASGHCLKKDAPDTRCLFQAAVPHVPSSIPSGHAAPPVTAYAAPRPAPTTTESPPPYPGINSTVMRT